MVSIYFCRHGHPCYVGNKEIITQKASLTCYLTGLELKTNKTHLYSSFTPRASISATYYEEALKVKANLLDFLTDGAQWLRYSNEESQKYINKFYKEIINKAKDEKVEQIILISHQPILDYMTNGLSPRTGGVIYTTANTWEELLRNLQIKRAKFIDFNLSVDKINILKTVSTQVKDIIPPYKMAKIIQKTLDS